MQYARGWKKRRVQGTYLVEATKIARNCIGLRFQCAFPHRSTIQCNESMLSNVETTSGGIDGGEKNPSACLRVGQLSALAVRIYRVSLSILKGTD